MRYLIGVDEAGRGPLAGPVAVGAILVPEGFDIEAEFPGVRDSKKLTEKKREELFALLERRTEQGDVRFAVEMEDASAIDEAGIVTAVQRALDRAVGKLAPDPSDVFIRLDGALRAAPTYAQETIIHGDALVPLISLASVAAKVTRDRLMLEIAKDFPGYGFEDHKGYGTKAHYAALAEQGLCVVHRRSFIRIAAGKE